MPLYGAVEIGGTKVDVAFGTTLDDLTDPVRLETTSPSETLEAIGQTLSAHELDRVGVACFGPLDRQTGVMRSTPKPGWSGAAIGQPLKKALGVEIVVETDVNGSAIGEGTWGAAKGVDNFAYVTVGTGIGAGVIIDGRFIGGASHPEAGHINVKRRDDDDFPGGCPFHGDCLEGMAAGPALEARFGEPTGWDEEVADLAAFYVGQGVRALRYVAALELVVVGGGVSKTAGFHDRLRRHVLGHLAEYPEPLSADTFVVPPGLGDLSGLAGALVLATADD